MPYPTPLLDDSGAMIGAVNVLVDVTERAAAERELRATAAALQASNAVKDEFLGLVSHELRTPVTTIFGNARLLHDRGDRLADRQKKSMVADIATDADRLLGLVENLLLLTKLGAGTHLELEPQVLDHVVKKAVESYRRRHPTRRIRIRRDPGHVVVDADRTYIELVIENLLSNADKYTPGTFPIDVSIRVVDGEAQVVIRDRGIGISDVEGRAVFEPFYRTEAARAQATGIGIGLAVCRQGGRDPGRSHLGPRAAQRRCRRRLCPAALGRRDGAAPLLSGGSWLSRGRGSTGSGATGCARRRLATVATVRRARPCVTDPAVREGP